MKEPVSLESLELLQATDLTTLKKRSSAWTVENLRVVPPTSTDNSPGHTLVPLDSTRNGHLCQWWVGEPFESQLHVALSLKARGDEGRVGVNIYLHFHPTEDEGRQVYQIQVPCNDQWETLTKVIPIGERPVHRIRLMIVARAGARAFSLKYASLRSVRTGNQGAPSSLVAAPYQAAVRAMVDRHPSSGDAAFRGKLTRYLLGANPKGIQTVESVAQRLRPLGISFRGARFLDLGSGTGGALVGAFYAGASYCEGWEINEEKRQLSAINLDSCGVGGDFVVRNQSMEAPDLLGDDFRPFDVVLCEDVLEHVKDLSAAMTTLGRCIARERGVGYVTMPNGFSLKSVLADPHLNLFGIVLLDRFEAQPMATALKNHTHYRKMMGTYLHYGDYVGRFRALGLEVTPLKIPAVTDATFRNMEADLRAIEARRQGLHGDWGEKVDGETLALLDARLTAYVAAARGRLAAAQGRGATDGEKLAVVRDYGVAHFAFLVQHGSGSVGR